jgi:hypothetical protein
MTAVALGYGITDREMTSTVANPITAGTNTTNKVVPAHAISDTPSDGHRKRRGEM